jgi:hypothetical protein
MRDIIWRAGAKVVVSGKLLTSEMEHLKEKKKSVYLQVALPVTS